jgi:hypothetical protein
MVILLRCDAELWLPVLGHDCKVLLKHCWHCLMVDDEIQGSIVEYVVTVGLRQSSRGIHPGLGIQAWQDGNFQLRDG